MIRDQHDDRALKKMPGLERVHECANMRIDVGEVAIIEIDDRILDLGMRLVLSKLGQGCGLTETGLCRRPRHPGKPRFGRMVGLVRFQVVEVGEESFLGVLEHPGESRRRHSLGKARGFTRLQTGIYPPVLDNLRRTLSQAEVLPDERVGGEYKSMRMTRRHCLHQRGRFIVQKNCILADESGHFFKDGIARYGEREFSSNIIRRLEDATGLDIRAPGFPTEILDDEPEEPGYEVVVERG